MARPSPRINWPYAAILLLAVLAFAFRVYLVEWYWLPRLLRHHMADFGYPAFFTAIFSTFIALLTPRRHRQQGSDRAVRFQTNLHMVIVLLGTLHGFYIELEDHMGWDRDGGFDPGIILRWLGAPDTDIFDSMDLVAALAGGIVVILLQWYSTQQLRRWRRFPLLLRQAG
ncbi:hypothetical protein JNJ66_00210 [Candidatus Saccharibacteria bacterium]|nr:hypothetical protein [Candidatus Saccharibacteria bacterium]